MTAVREAGVGRDLGTHQSGPGTEGVRLRQSRHHCGRDRGIFVSNRQVD